MVGVMDTHGIEAALREAGIVPVAVTPIPGAAVGDVVVFLARVLQEHQEAQRVLRRLPGVARVSSSGVNESILHSKLGPGLTVVR